MALFYYTRFLQGFAFLCKGFRYLNLSGITKFKYERKNEMNFFSSKNKSQRKQPIRPRGPSLLLVFSVTPFKLDQNKNQNRSIDKDKGNERRYIYKDPRQDSGQRNISYTRYPKKWFTQTYRDLYGDAMLVLTWMSSNMADGNQQKHLLPSFATKAFIYSSRNS